MFRHELCCSRKVSQHKTLRALGAHLPFHLFAVCILISGNVGEVCWLKIIVGCFFSIKSEEGEVVAGHAVQYSTPNLPCQASPPAQPSRAL